MNYKGLIVHTKPMQWRNMNMRFTIKDLRTILGEARLYKEICPSVHIERVKSTIKTVASLIDEHNRCVKEMCE